MRISDWSSDVCSSDLMDHTHHIGAPERLPLVEPRLFERRGGHAARTIDEQRNRPPRLGRPGDRRGDALGIADIAGDGLEAVPRCLGGGEPLGATPEERSEEHTSELQSLMRISYAVFCLITKKTYTQ